MSSTLALLWIFCNAAISQSAPTSGSAPGVFVEIGDHKMHINCVGPRDGKPVVLFESGGGADSRDWTTVQRLLAPRLRTCAYDRAGLGWSEPGPASRTISQEVFELHTLLQRAKIPTPLILVGQSIGAMNVRLYTERYGSDVAGIILIDPADENTILFSLTANKWMQLRDQAKGRTIPRPHLLGPPSTGYKPEEDYLGDEARLLYLHREKNPHPFGDRPLFVLAAGKRPPPPGTTEDSYKDIRRAADENRAQAASLSRKSKFLIDANAGHNIQVDDPTLVAKAIDEVVAAVNRHTGLSN